MYRPKHVVNDGIGQSVTYKGRSVAVSTGATYPARLQRLLRRLGRLMRPAVTFSVFKRVWTTLEEYRAG